MRFGPTRLIVIVALILGCLSVKLPAYWYHGSWPDGSIVMHLQVGSSGGTLIDGASSWGQSAEWALADWNQYMARTEFRVVRDSTYPIRSANGINNVFWDSTVYGSAFGSAAAYTVWWFNGSRKSESDVIFDNRRGWNSYRGNTRSYLDFHRFALHEFGHVLGLDHPNQHGQSVSAIMNSVLGNLDHLSADDIAGARALYGGSSAPSPPGAPSNLTASASGSTVNLSWRAPTSGGAPTAYNLRAGTSSGSSNLANFSTGNTATSFSTGGIGSGTYYIRVYATNSGGSSGASNEAVLTVGGCTAPSAPSGLSASVSGSTVNLKWSAGGGSPTSYVLEAGSMSGASNIIVSDTGSAATSFTATGVNRGTYYLRVRSRNACGTSGPSNEIVMVV